MFDMGPPIEELLARCEAETGLPAPDPPVVDLTLTVETNLW